MSSSQLSAGVGPIVSIGVPVYNGERFLRHALESLARQTHTDYELVIVDNGSTDATPEICRQVAERDGRVRYIRYDTTIPLVDNFCRVLRLAGGSFFLWNPADDVRPPDAIAQALEVFRRYPDTVLVHGPVELDLPLQQRTAVVDNDVMADGRDPAARVAAVTRRLRHNGILYGVYRRDALLRAIFRQHLGQDFLVALQMALIGPIRYVPTPLIRYRHVVGPIDNPMYWRRRVTLRGLVAWPTNRFKCLIVLYRGCQYLLQESGTPLSKRFAASVVFARAFIGRFWRHLVPELAFALSAPLGCALRPFTFALRSWLDWRTRPAN